MPSIDDIVSGAAVNDEVEIDFSGAVDFEPLPPGEYTAKVLKCEAGTSKSGSPKLAFTFGITGPTHVARQVTAHVPTTGKGSGRAKSIMKGLGFDIDGERVRFRPSASVGRECILVLDIQKDNEDFNDVKKVKPLSGSAL